MKTCSKGIHNLNEFHSQKEIEEYYNNDDWWDWDEDWNDFDWWNDPPIPEYKYTNTIYHGGRMIDMESIYDQATLRQRKIDKILGILSDIKKPNLGDIFPQIN